MFIELKFVNRKKINPGRSDTMIPGMVIVYTNAFMT